MRNLNSVLFTYLVLVFLLGCSAPQTQYQLFGEIPPTPICPPVYFPHGNPFLYLKTSPIASDFDFPVGPPNASGYYDAQPFGGSSAHLGEDWNGVGGGNTDLGDPVYSVADGVCFFAEDIFGGWGKVVRIVHKTGPGEFEAVESLYGHLNTFQVKEGEVVRKGQQIGTIGNAHGIYYAHLHLEMRDSLGLEIGPGYSGLTQGYLVPSEFIKSH